LIAGDLDVGDIPAEWNRRMKDELGLNVPSDREGCLQDIHWSSGMIGSFCTYTIGNIMAAQLFQAATISTPAINEALRSGDYAPLRHWLTEHVCRHGRRFSRQELLVQSTGRPLTVAPYLDYLSKKHGVPQSPVS
jgi:carboxypeptidase Taq